jgi:hypothetical protein
VAAFKAYEEVDRKVSAEKFRQESFSSLQKSWRLDDSSPDEEENAI